KKDTLLDDCDVESYLDLTEYVELIYTSLNKPGYRTEDKNELSFYFHNIKERHLNIKFINYFSIQRNIENDDLQEYLNIFCQSLNTKYFGEHIFNNLIFNHFFSVNI